MGEMSDGTLQHANYVHKGLSNNVLSFGMMNTNIQQGMSFQVSMQLSRSGHGNQEELSDCDCDLEVDSVPLPPRANRQQTQLMVNNDENDSSFSYLNSRGPNTGQHSISSFQRNTGGGPQTGSMLDGHFAEPNPDVALPPPVERADTEVLSEMEESIDKELNLVPQSIQPILSSTEKEEENDTSRNFQMKSSNHSHDEPTFEDFVPISNPNKILSKKESVVSLEFLKSVWSSLEHDEEKSEIECQRLVGTSDSHKDKKHTKIEESGVENTQKLKLQIQGSALIDSSSKDSSSPSGSNLDHYDNCLLEEDTQPPLPKTKPLSIHKFTRSWADMNKMDDSQMSIDLPPPKTKMNSEKPLESTRDLYENWNTNPFYEGRWKGDQEEGHQSIGETFQDNMLGQTDMPRNDIQSHGNYNYVQTFESMAENVMLPNSYDQELQYKQSQPENNSFKSGKDFSNQTVDHHHHHQHQCNHPFHQNHGHHHEHTHGYFEDKHNSNGHSHSGPRQTGLWNWKKTSKIKRQKPMPIYKVGGKTGNCGNCALCIKTANMENKLQELAASSGYIIQDVLPDGNCMFHSIIDQLKMQGDLSTTADKLRRDAVEYLKDNPYAEDGTHMEVFLSAETWDRYLTRMGQDGEWGDEMVLRGVAEVTRRNICIISAIQGGQHNHIIIQPSQLNDSEKRKTESDQSEEMLENSKKFPSESDKLKDIILGHMNDAHYVSLRSLDWKDTWYKNAEKMDKENRPILKEMESSTVEKPSVYSEEYLGYQRSVLFESHTSMIDYISSIPVHYLTFIVKNVIQSEYLYTPDNAIMAEMLRKITHSSRGTVIPVGSVVEGLSVSLKDISFYGLHETKERTDEKYPQLYFINSVVPSIKYSLDEVETSTEFVVETEHVHPGYLRLRAANETPTYLGLCDCIQGISYLSFDKLQRSTAKLKQHPDRFYEMKKDSNSGIYCALFVPSWPLSAMHWINRNRPSGWPKSSIIEQAISPYGCVVVPKFHPSSNNPNVEFMFSFAVAEKTIAMNGMRKSQRYGFYVLKVLLQFHLGDIVDDLSYLIKTVFFHACEVIPIKQWYLNLGAAVLYTLDQLLFYLRTRNIPHYFIQDNNLIDHLTEDMVLRIENRVSALRRFPCVGISLAAESKRLPTCWITGCVMEDIPRFLDRPDIRQSVTAVLLPIVYKMTQQYIQTALYSEAADVIVRTYKEITIMLKYSDGDEMLNIKEYVQDILASLTLSQQWWLCFFMDYFHDTDVLSAVIGSTDCTTVGAFFEDEDEEVDDLGEIKLPLSMLNDETADTSYYGGHGIPKGILFIERMAHHTFTARYYYVSAKLLRVIIKHVKQTIEAQSNVVSPQNQHRSSESPNVQVEQSTYFTEMQHYYVYSFLFSCLYCLYSCYFHNEEKELFQEYIEDLDAVCDKIPSARTYGTLATIWNELGNHEMYHKVIDKQKCFMD